MTLPNRPKEEIDDGMRDRPSYFRMLIVGPSACGKSRLLLRIMHQIYRDYDEHYLICPTMHQDLYKNDLKFKKENAKDEATNSVFDDVIEKIKKNHKDKKSSLLVLDDCLYSELTKTNSSLTNIFTRIRHYYCSIIIICQHYKAIAPAIRNNITHGIYFCLANSTAEKTMFEEYSDRFKEKYK